MAGPPARGARARSASCPGRSRPREQTHSAPVELVHRPPSQETRSPAKAAPSRPGGREIERALKRDKGVGVRAFGTRTNVGDQRRVCAVVTPEFATVSSVFGGEIEPAVECRQALRV